jgi:hypothetical protein
MVKKIWIEPIFVHAVEEFVRQRAALQIVLNVRGYVLQARPGYDHVAGLILAVNPHASRGNESRGCRRDRPHHVSGKHFPSGKAALSSDRSNFYQRFSVPKVTVGVFAGFRAQCERRGDIVKRSQQSSFSVLGITMFALFVMQASTGRAASPREELSAVAQTYILSQENYNCRGLRALYHTAVSEMANANPDSDEYLTRISQFAKVGLALKNVTSFETRR